MEALSKCHCGRAVGSAVAEKPAEGGTLCYYCIHTFKITNIFLYTALILRSSCNTHGRDTIICTELDRLDNSVVQVNNMECNVCVLCVRSFQWLSMHVGYLVQHKLKKNIASIFIQFIFMDDINCMYCIVVINI